MTRVVLFALAACLCLNGCSLLPWGGGDEREEFEGDEKALYQSAQRSMRAGNYNDAIAQLEHLEARYPFGRYGDQAQLELIFARYMAFQPDAARSAADRFIRLHPQHPNIDYAYYLKGLAASEKNSSMFDRFYTANPAKRDMTSAREAFSDFSQLVYRFPDSEYALDARQRMIYLRNTLAEAEVYVAEYYMRRGAFVAAANRARTVVEEYSTTPVVDQALSILVEANYKLGLETYANDALRVLAINYPNYESFDDNGQYVLAQNVQMRYRSWTNLVTFGLLDRPDVPPPISIQQPSETPRIAPRTVHPEQPDQPDQPEESVEDKPVIQAHISTEPAESPVSAESSEPTEQTEQYPQRRT